MRDGNIRSKLKPEFRKGYWFARGFVPIRQADGSIARRRVERGVGPDLKTKAERQAYCDTLNRYYEERALAIVKPMTFAKAYTNYVEAGHRVPYRGERILKCLGMMQVAEIDDSAMLRAAKVVFPRGVKPGTVNRHLYSPVIAILNMASKSKACSRANLTRPVGHKAVPPLEIPDRDWFRTVLPRLSADRVALVCFLTVHGRRLGDALGRSPADFDAVSGTLAIGKDKSGNPLLIELVPGVRDLFLEMRDWKSREWLFGVGPNSGSDVRRDILIACMKAAGLELGLMRGKGGVGLAKTALAAAGMKYHAPHSIGRHSFATRLLRAGYSLHHVKESGGWATIEMVSQRYGHLAKSETTVAVHESGNAWFADSFKRGGNRVEKPTDSSSGVA